MTPQAYPLFATDEAGDTYLVVGWNTTTAYDPDVPDMPYVAVPVLIQADRRTLQYEAAIPDPTDDQRFRYSLTHPDSPTRR